MIYVGATRGQQQSYKQRFLGSTNLDPNTVSEGSYTADPTGYTTPTVVWSLGHFGAAILDLTSQDVQVGDILVGFTLGFYTNGGSGGWGTAVTSRGWSAIYTNGGSANATHCSFLIVTAGNIGSVDWRHGNSAADSVVMCIRGADVAMFDTFTNGAGYPELLDKTIFWAGSVATYLNTGSVRAASDNTLVLSFGGYRDAALTYTPPSGYTQEHAGGGGVNGSLTVASKEVSASFEDPGAFSHMAKSSGRGYTLAFMPSGATEVVLPSDGSP